MKEEDDTETEPHGGSSFNFRHSLLGVGYSAGFTCETRSVEVLFTRTSTGIYVRLAPVDQVEFDGAAAAELVDNGAVGDVDRAVGLRQLVGPVALPERDGSQSDAVLPDPRGQVSLAAAHPSRRLGQADSAGCKNRARVASSKRRQLFDLLDGLDGELAERGFGIDTDFGRAIFLSDFAGRVLAEFGPERVDVGLARSSDRRPPHARRTSISGELQAFKCSVQVQSTRASAEPTPGFTPTESRAMITTGRWYFSARRPATIPMTPACQPLPANTSAASFCGSNCSFACLLAAR